MPIFGQRGLIAQDQLCNSLLLNWNASCGVGMSEDAIRAKPCLAPQPWVGTSRWERRSAWVCDGGSFPPTSLGHGPGVVPSGNTSVPIQMASRSFFGGAQNIWQNRALDLTVLAGCTADVNSTRIGTRRVNLAAWAERAEIQPRSTEHRRRARLSGCS